MERLRRNGTPHFGAAGRSSGDWDMKSVLRWAGRNGAAVVIAGVVIGLCAPLLSALARPYLAVAIFVFTFGSFLKFDASSIGNEASHMTRNLLMVAWTTFGVPLVMVAIIVLARPGPDLTQGLLFWSLVPASPACVAFAAILRLNVPVALLATVLGTAASPFYIPALAAFLGGYRLDINPIQTCLQLVFLVGGACLAAIAAKRVAGVFIRANPEAMTGIAVLAMFLAGMGSMRGMQAHLLAQPATSLEFVVLAYVLLFGAELTATFLFWRYGRTAALTAGLISGTRTITLAWVVLGDNVLPLADLFLATSMIAKYTAPGLTKWLLTRILAAEAVVAVAATDAAGRGDVAISTGRPLA
jgi:BASS family bile acid:Na+ symporter